jgi:hypothetical protein
LDGGGLSDGNAAWKDQHFLAAAATYLTQNGLGDKLMLGTAQSGREGQKFLESNDES